MLGSGPKVKSQATVLWRQTQGLQIPLWRQTRGLRIPLWRQSLVPFDEKILRIVL